MVSIPEEGEYIKGVEEKMEGDKLKIASIQAPMTNGKLMCEVERRSFLSPVHLGGRRRIANRFTYRCTK